MQAVILAGGYSTRIKHLYPNLPKALFPVGGKAFLEIYLQILIDEGFSEIILATKYLSEKIEEQMASLPKEIKNKVKIIRSSENIRTVGELVELSPMLNQKFFVFFCDILFKGILKKAFEEFDNKNFSACSLVSKDYYGMFENMEELIDEKNKKVLKFEPYIFSREEGWLDVGHLFDKSIIQKLNEYPPTEEHINKNIYPRLIAENKLTYYKVGPIFDIGTERTYSLTNEIYKEKGLDALNIF